MKLIMKCGDMQWILTGTPKEIAAFLRETETRPSAPDTSKNSVNVDEISQLLHKALVSTLKSN